MNAAEKIDLHQVVIGIGSNIQPEVNVPRAIDSLSKFTRIIKISNIYRTSPVGSDGPDFLNAAVLIETELPPDDLRVFVLRRIESDLGRRRSTDPNAPRTIDLDFLIYDGIIVDENVWDLAHVCVPVADLLPLFTDPKQDNQLKNRSEHMIRQTNLRTESLEFHWRRASGDII